MVVKTVRHVFGSGIPRVRSCPGGKLGIERIYNRFPRRQPNSTCRVTETVNKIKALDRRRLLIDKAKQKQLQSSQQLGINTDEVTHDTQDQCNNESNDASEASYEEVLGNEDDSVRRTGIFSNVYQGTKFEATSRDFLNKCGFRLDKVGGRGDGGVDLTGSFELNNDMSNSSIEKSNVNVFAQCKHYKIGIGPSHIRELAGVLSRRQKTLESNTTTVGVILGQVPWEDVRIAMRESSSSSVSNRNSAISLPTAFTKDSILACLRSNVPLALVTLSEINPDDSKTSAVLVSWLSNRAFSSNIPGLVAISGLDQTPPRLQTLVYRNKVLVYGYRFDETK